MLSTIYDSPDRSPVLTDNREVEHFTVVQINGIGLKVHLSTTRTLDYTGMPSVGILTCIYLSFGGKKLKRRTAWSTSTTGIERSTSRLPVLRAQHLGHQWGVQINEVRTPSYTVYLYNQLRGLTLPSTSRRQCCLNVVFLSGGNRTYSLVYCETFVLCQESVQKLSV